MRGSSGVPRRLRVALLGEYPVHEGGIHEGGVQSVTYHLAHALARRDDVECHVVAAMSGAVTDYRREGNLHVHYVKRLPLPKLLTCKVHDIPALKRIVEAIDPDVVHGQEQDRHGLAALRSGYPAVVTPHGVTFIESRLLKRNRFDLLGEIKVRMLVGWEREVFARAAEMIVISRYLPQIYGAMLQAHISFIDNPIDADFFSLARAPVPGRLLFVGTVVPRKCVPDLVRAFRLLHRRLASGSKSEKALAAALHFRIVGPWLHPKTERLLRRLITDLGLERQVTLVGALSEVDLIDEYSRAHLLLVGSREETAPQVIAQAMACGLPTIASAVGGIPAMIEDGFSGLLFPFGDAQKCCDQILRLLQNERLANLISQRIRDEARRRFHPDAVARKTVEVYRSAASRQIPGAALPLRPAKA